jgi:hypothetical protein
MVEKPIRRWISGGGAGGSFYSQHLDSKQLRWKVKGGVSRLK